MGGKTSSSNKKLSIRRFELRLKNLNKCVGKITITKTGCNVRALFSTENDGTFIGFDKVKPLDELKLVWCELMDKLLDEIFIS